MAYVVLQSGAYNNVLVRNVFVRPPIFDLRLYARTVICGTLLLFKHFTLACNFGNIEQPRKSWPQNMPNVKTTSK